MACTHPDGRRAAPLVVTWEVGQAAPWLVRTDLAPGEVGPAWSGLRCWVELGFRALKRLDWHWERTRRGDPERVARQWLVLAVAVATRWTVATGTRDEDAVRLGRAPANLPPPPPGPFARTVRVFARGLARLRWQLTRCRRRWSAVWLWPEPWPGIPAGLTAVVVPAQAPLPP